MSIGNDIEHSQITLPLKKGWCAGRGKNQRESKLDLLVKLLTSYTVDSLLASDESFETTILHKKK